MQSRTFRMPAAKLERLQDKYFEVLEQLITSLPEK
jgi:hypothetical protein